MFECFCAGGVLLVFSTCVVLRFLFELVLAFVGYLFVCWFGVLVVRWLGSFNLAFTAVLLVGLSGLFVVACVVLVLFGNLAM